MNRIYTISIIAVSIISLSGCAGDAQPEVTEISNRGSLLDDGVIEAEDGGANVSVLPEPGDFMRVDVFKIPFRIASGDDAEISPETPYLYYGYLVEVIDAYGNWVRVRTSDPLITEYHDYRQNYLEGWVPYRYNGAYTLQSIPGNWPSKHPTLREFLGEAPSYTRPLAGGIPQFIMAVGYGIDFAGRADYWEAWYEFGDDDPQYIRAVFESGEITASLTESPPEESAELGWMPPYGEGGRLAPAFVDSDCIGDPVNVERYLGNPGVNVETLENVMLGGIHNRSSVNLGLRGGRYNLGVEGVPSDFTILFDSSVGEFVEVK